MIALGPWSPASLMVHIVHSVSIYLTTAPPAYVAKSPEALSRQSPPVQVLSEADTMAR